jgi:hypothetical protein
LVVNAENEVEFNPLKVKITLSINIYVLVSEESILQGYEV